MEIPRGAALTGIKSSAVDGHVVRDERDAWSEHQPSADQENEFIRLNGFP
jgi:hypothetical protein